MRFVRLVRSAVLLVSLRATGATRAGAEEPPIRFVANVPYTAGSDVEFATKQGRDYAFAGRTSEPVQVIDITDPERPFKVAEIPCRLNQNDVQVAGDVLVMAADSAGSCIRPDGSEMSVRGFATADVSDPRNPVVLGNARINRGGHNVTVHPLEPLVYVSNSDGSAMAIIHSWDIADPAHPRLVQDWTYLPNDSPHDITFNAAGTRAYAASLSHTDIIDTTDPRNPVLIANIVDPTVTLSHQSDPTPDGNYLIVSDEAGGGLFPLCPGGGLHIYDISVEAAPVKVGAYFADNTGFFGVSCTSHVFRVNPDGQTLSIAWYNAGVHVVDLRDFQGVAAAGSGAVTGIGGRTLASMRMPSAATWSAKMWQERHPGYVFANDLRRGFDVFFVLALAA